MADSSTMITKVLPPETLRWRLREWLLLGSFVFDDKKVAKLKNIPTLIITGSSDRLLPSKLEGRRLKGLFAAAGGKAELKEMEGAGHALMDDDFKLVQLLRDSETFRGDYFVSPPTPVSAAATASANASALPPRQYSVAMPSQADLDEADKQLNGISKALSPVWLSRDKVGLGWNVWYCGIVVLQCCIVLR
jgi:acetyl esterase/lipase